MRFNIFLVLISAFLVGALPKFGGGFRSAASHVGVTLTHAATSSSLRHESEAIPASRVSGYRPRPVPAPVGGAGQTGSLPVSLTKSSSPPPPNNYRAPASSYGMYTGGATHRFYPIIIPLHHFENSRSSSTGAYLTNRNRGGRSSLKAVYFSDTTKEKTFPARLTKCHSYFKLAKVDTSKCPDGKEAQMMLGYNSHSNTVLCELMCEDSHGIVFNQIAKGEENPLKLTNKETIDGPSSSDPFKVPQIDKHINVISSPVDLTYTSRKTDDVSKNKSSFSALLVPYGSDMATTCTTAFQKAELNLYSSQCDQSYRQMTKSADSISALMFYSCNTAKSSKQGAECVCFIESCAKDLDKKDFSYHTATWGGGSKFTGVKETVRYDKLIGLIGITSWVSPKK